MDPNKQKVDNLLKKYGSPTATSAPAAAGAADPEMDSIFNAYAPADKKPFVEEKKSVGGFIKNVGKSGAELLKGVVNALIHPIDTAKGLGTIALGAGQKLIGVEGDAAATVDNIVEYYKTRYGKDLKNTLYEDPVGVLADLSTVLGGAGLALRGGSKLASLSEVGRVSGASNTATRLATKAADLSRKIDPLNIAGKAGGFVSRESGATAAVTKAKDFTSKLFNKADDAAEATRTGAAAAAKTSGVRKPTGFQKVALDSGMDEITQNVLRKTKPGETPAAAAARLEKSYTQYAAAEDAYKLDPSKDMALNVAGNKIGDGYDAIIKKSRDLGKELGKARFESSSPVPVKQAIDKITSNITSAGFKQTPRGWQQAKQTTSLSKPEVKVLSTMQKKLNKLKNPTAQDIYNLKDDLDDMVNREFNSKMIKKGNNFDRIIKGIRYELDQGIKTHEAPDVKAVAALEKEYSRLQNLLGEGEGFVGKRSPNTGEYMKDASLAKAAITSVHGGAKKDFLINLGKETGVDYIQEAYTAAQAMKDAGNAQAESLLTLLHQNLLEGNAPTPRTIVGDAVKAGVRKTVNTVAGEPKARTLRYIKEGDDTASAAGAAKTRKGSAKSAPAAAAPAPQSRGGRALRYAKSQLGYGKAGRKNRTRNATINRASGNEE